jgi:hypothetical protein
MQMLLDHCSLFPTTISSLICNSICAVFTLTFQIAWSIVTSTNTLRALPPLGVWLLSCAVFWSRPMCRHCLSEGEGRKRRVGNCNRSMHQLHSFHEKSAREILTQPPRQSISGIRGNAPLTWNCLQDQSWAGLGCPCIFGMDSSPLHK